MPAVKLLRSNSLGIKGTYRNANHHAQKLVPLIDALVEALPGTKYKTWIQAHNVHILETVDGRKFVLRPYTREDEGYVGLTISTKISRSKDSEVYLFSVEHDTDPTVFVKRVKALAKPNPAANCNAYCEE
jgi:hypothetical protein